MYDIFVLVIGASLVNNFVLVKFLGLCPFMGISKKAESALGMGLATTFVMTLTSVITYIIEHYLLRTLNLICLRTLIFIFVIAAVVQFIEIVLHKIHPVLHNLLGIFLPLITTNCAVLGVALLSVTTNHNFLHSIIFAFAAASGFSLVLVLFASLRERLNQADIPMPFQGNAVGLITAGIISLAFMGFSGFVRT